VIVGAADPKTTLGLPAVTVTVRFATIIEKDWAALVTPLLVTVTLKV
jgi:hypothetical protein